MAVIIRIVRRIYWAVGFYIFDDSTFDYYSVWVNLR